MSTNDFLKDYQNCELRHVIMPGSHDAGLAREHQADLSLLSSRAATVTQADGVGAQAAKGSRFFDVRIQLVGHTLKAYHTAPNPLQHIPLLKKIPGTKTDTRTFGASGQGFSEILAELGRFVQSNPTEFVIVRLSHLKDSQEIFRALAAWIAAVPPGLVHKGTGNLARVKVGALAGKLVFIVESKKLKAKNLVQFSDGSRVPQQSDGFHSFYQSKGGNLPLVTDGLCVCGEFSNANKIEKIMSKQLRHYSHHDAHRNHQDAQAHLYMLYWTATGGNIAANTQRQLDPTNFHRVKHAMAQRKDDETKLNVGSLKQWSDIFAQNQQIRQASALNAASIPNIVLYDFIDRRTSEDIIKLNQIANGTVV